MREAIGNRELMTFDCLGVRLRGTHHLPVDRRGIQQDVGVLFVNSLTLPRAAAGDSAVDWADALAERGYSSFRIDLPGLGDSEGQASTDLLDSIDAGGFASVTAAAARHLVDRYGLSGMVIFGHCAGSVSALFAGAACPVCKGLILLDPYFHLPQAKRSRVREELSGWARRSGVGRLLSNIYDRARDLRLALRGNLPPGNANTRLLACWKQLAGAGTPILLLQAPGIKAQGSKPRVGEFDYIEYVLKLAGRKSRVSAEFVDGADHSFANCEGRAAVERHVADWLVSHFPVADSSLSAESVSSLRAGENQFDSHESQIAPADRYCALEGR
jgi:alpha-beta hydrolase superfamily lysophospholipase